MRYSSLLRKFLVIAGTIVLTACALDRVSDKPGMRERGTASWYGPRFHGKLTASGERFNMYEMTAAHPTLPFGTMVEVRWLETRKKVVVRINDRGPYGPGRIIDLSYAAAHELGIIKQGLVDVEITVLNRRSSLTLAWENFQEAFEDTAQPALDAAIN